jgi:hypothetical protein
MVPSSLFPRHSSIDHSRYFNWPYKLLEPLPNSQEQRQVDQRFFDAHPCCLDSWFSEPFRAKAGTVAGMQTEEMLLLRHRLTHDLTPTTNMALEGLLAEIKAAVPKGKKSQNAEKVAMLAFLGKVLKQHIASGRKDCRGSESRQALLSKGVPLEHQPQAQPCRSDTRWRNVSLAQWQRDHPDASQAAVRAQGSFAGNVDGIHASSEGGCHL